MEAWRSRQGWGVEVVSEYEYLAARAAGFAPRDIVANGVAKHRWLPTNEPELVIHLDSVGEATSLAPRCPPEQRWGVRCCIPAAHNPSDATVGAQFGVTAAELREITNCLTRQGGRVRGLHFHLQSNVRDAAVYASAVSRVLEMARAAGVTPEYIDCGGGFPVPGQVTLEHSGPEGRGLDLDQLARSLATSLATSGISEVWFENGRFVTARSAVLVARVVDVKIRDGVRLLICDGGRTNHALPADWEQGVIETVPPRSAQPTPTVVYGPTCTAFDRLFKGTLPADIDVGDCLVRLHAGAYYNSWETRFSRGLATVIWCDERRQLHETRRAESSAEWFGLR
jgi:ornithine decarboxylase